MKGLTRWQKGCKSLVAIVFLSLLVLQPAILPGVMARAAVDTVLEEARMLELVNKARNSAGLPSLTMERRLTEMARSYSREMVQYGFFGHVSPVSGSLQQRISASGITGWSLAGENLAKAPSTEVAFQALMDSPSHRQNILRAEFNCVGIGVVEGPDGLYITQEFMRLDGLSSGAGTTAPSSPGTTSQAQQAACGNTFDTYILIMNPNQQTAQVELTFQSEDGSTRTLNFGVGACSRFTVPVREAVGTGSFSASVRSDIPVLAERAMYFDYQGKAGGSDSIGTPNPSNTWFFAEGYTGGSFDTWVLLQNPNDAPATVTLSFMRSDGAVITRQVSVPGRRRHSVHVDDIPGLESADVSTQVSSDLPIVAERAMYFDYQGKAGGSDSIGTPNPSNTWFFAEGYTGGSFDTWVLLQNPNDAPATVTLSFMRSDGAVITRQVSVPGRRRHSVHVDDIPGLESADVSTQVSSDLPIVAERAMYFDYQGRRGGHASVGATATRERWYLPEGYTGGQFDEYVLLFNPNPKPALLKVTFMRSDGARVDHLVPMAPRSRYTVHVDDLEGLQDCEVSTAVEATLPVVVELAQYFDYRGRCDGNNSIGATEPSNTWFFAEGCVL